MSEELITMMSLTEAREKTDQAKEQIRQIDRMVGASRRLIFELYQKEAWRVLGFANFVAYAKAEFEISKTHCYRLVEGARVETLIGNETVSLSQSESAELSRLPDELVSEVWQKANAEGRPKPYHLKLAVDQALGIKPKKKRIRNSGTQEKPKTSESVQVIVKPHLGTTEARWKPRAAEGVTLIFHINRDTDLARLTKSLDGIDAQVDAAIAKLYAADATDYATTLPVATHSEY